MPHFVEHKITMKGSILEFTDSSLFSPHFRSRNIIVNTLTEKQLIEKQLYITRREM